MQVLIGEHNLLPNNYLGEREKLTQAKNLIEEVVKDFTKNSVTLGFKAVDRCYFCGKPAVTIDKNGHYVCVRSVIVYIQVMWSR